MQTEERITKPVKFITIVKNTGSRNSLCMNNNTVDTEEKDQNSINTGSLSMADENDLDDVFNHYFHDDEISEGCSSSDDMISFGSAFNSVSSLTSEHDDEHVNTISTFSASLPADSLPAADIMPSPKHGLREQTVRPQTPSSGVYPYVRQPRDKTKYSHRLSRCKSTTSDLSTASLTTEGFTAASFSLAESQTSALTFANQALERSHIRRMSYAASNEDLFTLPSSLLCRPNSAGQSVPEACASTTASSSDNSHIQFSTSQSSNVSSSAASSVLARITETVNANIAMLEDYDHSARAGLVQSIKRRMRSMEIQYYRTKCVRSLRISMAVYKRIQATDDSTASVSSSTRSLNSTKLLIEEDEESLDEVKPSRKNSHFAMEVARDILCFNLVLAMAYMIFVLYKDTISHAIRSIDTTNMVTVAN